MNPLVSIIMPSYKRKPLLVERAINSLVNQSYKNIEIILVDDNAKEEHKQYRLDLELMVKRLNISFLKYIQNDKNLGGSLSRNNGIFNSTGEYITFLDDDDIYEINKIENQIKYMLDNDLDVCISELAIYNENDKLVDYREHNAIESFDNDYLFRYHLTKQITGTPTLMYKAHILKQIGGFDDALAGQEFFLMAKTIKANVKMGYLKQSNIRAYRYDIEAISTGPNKIKGEMVLYKYKKEHFNLLSRKERRYIRCRHYAVMSVSYRRNKKLIKCLLNLLLAILIDPILSIKEARGLKKRKKEFESK